MGAFKIIAAIRQLFEAEQPIAFSAATYRSIICYDFLFLSFAFSMTGCRIEAESPVKAFGVGPVPDLERIAGTTAECEPEMIAPVAGLNFADCLWAGLFDLQFLLHE